MAVQRGRGRGISPSRPVDAVTEPIPSVGADGQPVRDRARVIPEAAVARLAVYLRVLTGLSEQGVGTIASEELSSAAGVNSAKLRKDLSYVGSYGTRGVGYEVAVLIEEIERILGLTRQHSVAVVGIGNLGHALANYGGFRSRGFPVAALFDVEEDLIGVPVGGIPVDHIDDIPRICAERDVSIGVVATPPAAAQVVCDRLVSAGVRCILNFAPVVLQVPDDVEVRKVDLAVEMQILSFHVARRADEAAEEAAAGGALSAESSSGGAHRADGTGRGGTSRDGNRDAGGRHGRQAEARRGRSAEDRASEPVDGAEVSGVNGMVIRR